MGRVAVHVSRSRGVLGGLRIPIPMGGWVRISIKWRLWNESNLRFNLPCAEGA